MTSSSYKFMTKSWREDIAGNERSRLIRWRHENTVTRLGKPTRPDKARRLGYSAKTGFVIVRVRVGKGGSKREMPARGRAPSKMGLVKYSPKLSQRVIAEQRAAKKYIGLEVLNSYFAGEDGRSKWFEVILVDVNHPQIRSDHRISWIANAKGRVRRGLTSAGKKSRGLHHKGSGVVKNRPSIGAKDNKGK